MATILSTHSGNSSSSGKDYDKILRDALTDSTTVANNLKSIYARYREIVGPLVTDETGRAKCQNCQELYNENSNHGSDCTWYSKTHKGLYRTDHGSDFWYGWHEANPPQGSSYWKDGSYSGKGGHKWTGCNCTNTNDECERQGRHRPEGYPPSEDEWVEEESAELSDDEFDEDFSRTLLQENLVEQYISNLVCSIRGKLHEGTAINDAK